MELEGDITYAFKCFQQYKHENLESICDLLNYGRRMKSMELTSKTAFVLQKLDNCSCFGWKCPPYRLIQQTGFVRVARSFKANTYFREFMYGNGIGKSLISFESNKMIHIHQGKKTITMTREFYDSDCIMTIEIDGIVAKRYFKFKCMAYGNTTLV